MSLLCPYPRGFLVSPIAALSIGSLSVSCSHVNASLFETSDSTPVPGDTIRNIRSPSIVLRVTLVGHKLGKEISAKALLDSGAEGIIIDHAFAMKHKLTLRSLLKPLPVRNVDGTLNRQGAIRHTTIQTLRIKNHATDFHQEHVELYVTSLADQDIIFGTDWLRAHNPEVNWSRSQIVFSRCPVSCHLSKYPVSVEPTIPLRKHTTINQLSLDPVPDFYDDLDFLDTGLDIFLSLYHLIKEDLLQISAKTTTSTELAACLALSTPLVQVPAQYRMYAKVFSEQASHRLPQHQPWDHAIDLIPGTTFRKCSVYHLTPNETTALKDYITDHLCQGYIHPSKLPMASPFFFVDKKDGKLCPVQDYHHLNDITVKNAAPLPLIPDLIDKLHNARYFTKLNICWGYNNIHIHHGDEWKAAFKTPLGLFEPLVMTFGLCNAPATFQTFMNDIFEDLLDQGHVVIYLDDILIFHDSLLTLCDLTHHLTTSWQV